MSLIRGQSSAVQSTTNSIEFIFSSTSLNNGFMLNCLSSNSDQSSPCLTRQCHTNDIGARNDHCLPSSLHKDQNLVGIVTSLVESGFNGVPDKTGNLISDDDIDQGFNLNAGGANNSDVARPRLSVGSSSNVDHSVEAPSSLEKQEDISSDSEVSVSSLAGKTREVEGASRHTFEVGSSSGSQQAENLSSNHSVHLNDSSSYISSMSSWNFTQVNSQEFPVLRTSAGLQSSSNTHPHPSVSVHPVMPNGNFNPGPAISICQIPTGLTLYNALLASGNPLLPLVVYPSQSPLPMFQWLNDNYVDSRPSSSPDMSRMAFIRSVSGNLPQSPLTINSNLRAGSSIESGLLPELQGHSHHPQHRSLAVGSNDALGGASIHQMEHNVNFIQLPSLPLASPSTIQAGRRQTTLDYPSGFLSPWNGLGSSAGNFDFSPSPYPATYRHHGHSIVGQNPYFSDPSASQFGHNPRRVGVHHISQSMEADVERNQRPTSEPLPQLIIDAPIEHQMHFVQPQATNVPPVYYAHHIAIGYPAAMCLQDMHYDMRLDVDNMSYEELLALEEHIGNVCTGLREETIMELLKRRNYVCVGTIPISDAETCCVCREEFDHGEEIGELNCGHAFHTGCIKQWLIIKNTCPICQVKGLGE